MNILLLGACDSSNLGDPVICDCVASWLRSHFPMARLTVRDLYRRGNRENMRESDMESLRKSVLKQKIIRLATGLGVDLTCHFEQRRVAANLDHIETTCAGDYDAVVFAGGQMFMDRYALFLEAYICRFREREIPAFFNACGTGPAHSHEISRRLKETLQSPNVRWISCRDDAARISDSKVTCHETFDPALTTAGVYGVRRMENTDTIGLGVIFNQAVSEKQQTRFWQNLVRELDRRGQKWQFFTNGDPMDMTYARTVLASMPECRGREDLLHPRDRQPEDFVRTIAGYRSILSFRLHSHIVAASLDVPSVAMVWDDKLPFFFEKIGHPERCFPVDSDPETVLTALERAQREGYDRALLACQAKRAEEQLIRAMVEAVPELAEGCL